MVGRVAEGCGKGDEAPELGQAFRGMGATGELVAADALAQQIAAERKRWQELARSIGIRPGAG